MDIAKALIPLNKQNVLDKINFRDIYKYYMGGKLVYNKSFSSPFRQDKNPSFVVSSNSGYFRDFATGESGDCFDFVMKLYSIDFYPALKQIVHDLGISDDFIIEHRAYKQPKKAKVENISCRGRMEGEFNLKVKVRKFETHDLEYWNKFGVSLKYLKMGTVYPISHYFINNRQFIAEKYAYVYVELKDGVETYKVYQPFSHSMKWINGNNYSVWELWRLMPKTHGKLIITSSRKDALSIIENCKIPATSFQAESINPKPHVVKSIMDRFEKVYLLYDNDYSNPDNPGQMLAKKRTDQYDFINLVIPEYYKSKDFSDLVYNHGRVAASLILQTLIDNHP